MNKSEFYDTLRELAVAALCIGLIGAALYGLKLLAS